MYSQYLNEHIDVARELVQSLLKKYEYVSILGKHITGKCIRVTTSVTLIKDSFEVQCGFVIKVFDQGLYKEYSFTDLSKDNIPNIISSIDQELKLSQTVIANKMNLSLFKDEPLVKDFIRPTEGRVPSVEEAVAKLNIIKDKLMAYSPKIIQAITLYDRYEVSSFFISKHRELTQSFSWNNVIYLAVSKEKDVMKDARGVQACNDVEKCFDLALADADNVASRSIEMLKATPIEPGTYDIITDSSISGLIAHEAFGHGVEMDMFVKHRAKSRLYINKPVASKLVSMHDGAAAALSAASYFFDDDGVLAHDTLIIDKGILVNGISDSTSANELGQECTGNSRRESPSRKAYSRMTNTFFSAGNDNLEDMIKSIKHGYMLFQTNNGMEDPKNWNIQCTAEYGKEIKDGKFTGKIVGPVVMSGYVPDLLMSISMVSKEVVITGSGHCGKGYKEWVPVSDGGPCLKARCKLS